MLLQLLGTRTLYCTVLYVLYCTVLYCTVLPCTVLYCTRYPHLTALLFTALLSLSASQARAAGAGKEVARISSR